MANIIVNPNVTSTNVTVTMNDTMTVMSNGSAKNTTVKTGGSMFVSSGGIITSTHLENGAVINGFVMAESSFMENGLAVSGVTMASGNNAFLFNGQTANTIAMTNGAILTVSSGGTASNLTVSSGAALRIFSGASMTATTLSSGAVVNSFTIQKDQNIAQGLAVSSAVVSGGVTAELYAGLKVVSGDILADAEAVIYNRGVISSAFNSGTLSVSSGGSVVGLSSWQAVYVYGGGTVSKAEILDGSIQLFANAKTVSTTLSTGSMTVLSGATATSNVISGGTATVSAGGSMNTVEMSDGSLQVYGGNVISLHQSGGSVIVGLKQGNTPFNGNISGGSVTDGTMRVLFGGISDLTVTGSGTVTLAGQTVTSTTVPPNAAPTSYSSVGVQLTSAVRTVIESGGNVSALGSNVFTSTTIHSGGTLNGFTAQITNEIASTLIHSSAVVSGAASLFKGESAKDVSVKNGGLIQIDKYDSASVAGLTLSSGGSILVSNGGVLILNGKTTVMDGAGIQLDRHIIHYADRFYYINENNSQVFDLISGDHSSSYYSPVLNVSSAMFTSVTYLYEDKENPTLITGSNVTTSSFDPYNSVKMGVPPTGPDGWTKVTGKIPNSENYYTQLIDAGSQAKIRFDFTADGNTGGLAANEAMLNDISAISIHDTGVDRSTLAKGQLDDSPRYEFVYTADLYDTYIIAGGAAGFGLMNNTLGIHDETFCIVNANGTSRGGTADSIYVGGSGTDSSGVKFTLSQQDGFLYMGIYKANTAAPTITVKGVGYSGNSAGNQVSFLGEDEWTNQSVTVTARFSQNTLTKQYQISYDSGSTWTSAAQYKAWEGVQLEDNAWVKFTAAATGGATSVVTVKVDKIDTIAPTFTIARETAPTSLNVVLTVSAKGDNLSGFDRLEYQIDDGDWMDYNFGTDADDPADDPGILVTSNGTVHFRAYDKAGNVAEEDVVVDNIYKTAPAAPVVVAQYPDANTPTNQTVTVTVTFESTASGYQNQYSLTGEDGSWQTCTGTVVADQENQQFYFRTINPVGYISTVTEYTVTNIDLTAPDAPTVSSSPTELTDQVILTATYNETDSVKEYSLDNANWSEYTGPLAVTVNGTWYFRETDLAGNVSPVTSATVNNIAVGDAPAVTPDTTDWTNQDVTLTVSKVTGTAVGLTYYYQLRDPGAEEWGAEVSIGTSTSTTSNIDTITITANKDVKVWAVETANTAHSTYITTLSISNIDKTAPTISVTQDPTEWTAGDVTLTITASDEGGSGLDTDSYEFSLDNGATWASLTGSTYVAEQNGDYMFRVKDIAGNETEITHNVSKIDKTAPVISSVSQTPDDWTNGDVTLTINASDVGSGIKTGSYEVSLDDGATWSPLEGNTYVAAQNGSYKFRVSDNVDNVSEVFPHTVSKIDKTAPTISSVSQSTDAWTMGPVTLTVTASDEGGSGLDAGSYEVSLDDGATWSSMGGNTYAAAQNGKYKFRVSDNVDNVSEVFIHTVTNIDTTPPEISVVQNKNSWTKSDVTLTITASDDDGSGVDAGSYQYWDGSAWKPLTASTYVVSENGVYKFRVSDNVGNSAEYEHTVSNIDKTAPVIDSVTQDPAAGIWTNTDVTLTINVTETGSGIASYEISLDDGATWAALTDNTYVAAENGDYKFRATDNVSLVSAEYAYTVSSIDKTGEVINVTQSTYDWTNADVTLTFTAPVSGTVSYEVSPDDGVSWIALGDNTYAAPANGVYKFRAKDSMDNVFAQYTHTLSNIDKTAPTIDSVTPSTTSWTNADVTLTINASDEGGSGLDTASYEVSLDDGATWTSLADNTYVAAQNGSYKFRVKDVAGNVSAESTQAVSKIDKIAPTIASVTPSETAWTNADVTLTITASDEGGSGIADYEVSLDEGATWTSMAGSNTYAAAQNGSYKFRVKDAAGNVSAESTQAVTNIDKILPTISVTQDPTEWTAGDVTLTITASDEGGSGLDTDSYEFSLDNGATWASLTGSTYVAEQNGDYMFRVKDIAGNVAEITHNVSNIDKTVPAIVSVTQDPAASIWTNSDVTLTINVSGTASGIASYEVTQDEGDTWTTLTGNTFVVTGNGYYGFRVTDNVGHVSPEYTHKVENIDKAGAVINVTQSTDAWTNADVTLTLTVPDIGSVVVTYEVSQDEGATWIVLSDNTYAAPANGVYKFRAKNDVDSVFVDYTHTVSNIDKIVPTITAATSTDAWTNADVTVTLSSTDEGGSGIAGYEVSLDQGATWTSLSGNTYAVAQNGSYKFRVKDTAGNSAEITQIVSNIDKIAPTVQSVVPDTISWTNADVSLTITAVDEGGSGIAGYEVSLDDGATWTGLSGNTYAAEQNGGYLFRVKDIAGNSVDYLQTVSNIDKIAPTISVTQSTDDWTNADVALTITAADEGGSGVDTGSYEISLDNGATWTALSGSTYVVAENGDYMFRVKDIAGNVTEITHTVFNIDRIAPVIDSVTQSTDSPTNADVVLTINATDEGTSGLARYEYWDGTDWTVLAGNTYAAEQNGSYKFRVKDIAGNAAEITHSVSNIDKILPTIQSIVPDIISWTNGNVTLTITAADEGGSGIAGYEVSLDAGASWTALAANTYVAEQNASYTFRVTDAAGNSVESILMVDNIDKIAPTINSVTQSTDDWTNAGVTLMINAADDGGSGLDPASYEVSLDAGVSWTALAGNTYTVEQNGSYQFRVKDIAGNATAIEHTVSNIDKIAPTVQSIVQDINSWTNGNVTLTINAADEGGSGIAGYEYWDGAAWTVLAGNTFTATDNGSWTFRVLDGAGNVSGEFGHTVANIDRIPPAKPTASADITIPTHRNVTVSAVFSADSAQKQYSLDASNWTDYTTGVVLSANGTVYFRGIDAAGNISEVESLTVSNIQPEEDSYTIYGDASGVITVDVTESGAYVLTGDNLAGITGTVTVLNGGMMVGTGTVRSGVLNFNNGNPFLLDSSLDTVIRVASENVLPSGYSMKLTLASAVQPDPDPGPYVPPATEIADTPGQTLIPIADVGSNHEVAYHDIQLNNAANLSLTINSTGAVKYSLFSRATGKAVLSGKVKAGTSLTTKTKLLAAGSYYLAVQSTDAKKGGSADYSVSVSTNTVFYTKGNNDDDTFATAWELGTVTTVPTELFSDWVGVGDAIDYRKITLTSNGKLSFSLTASDNAKLMVYQTPGGKAIGSVTVKGSGMAVTKDIFVSAGTYYLAVQSPKAKKDGNADYSVMLNDRSRFFPQGDNGNDTWQAASARDAKLTGEEITGWVGYGDAKDFIKFELSKNGQIKLDLDGTTAGALASKQIKLTCLDANGKSVALASFDGDTLVSKKDVQSGVYYLGVACSNVKKFDTSYSVTTGVLVG